MGETVPVTHLFWKGRCEGGCALEIWLGVFLREALAVSTLVLRTLQGAAGGQPGSFPKSFTARE